MHVVRLYFGTQEFVLPQDSDVVSLKKRILEAAAGPPSFVAFETVSRASVSMLVTSASTVRLETREVIDDGPETGPVQPYAGTLEEQHLFDEFEF